MRINIPVNDFEIIILKENPYKKEVGLNIEIVKSGYIFDFVKNTAPYQYFKKFRTQRLEKEKK